MNDCDIYCDVYIEFDVKLIMYQYQCDNPAMMSKTLHFQDPNVKFAAISVLPTWAL